MTQTAIKTQIEAIKNASAKAQKTPETALKFLKDAGILRTVSHTGASSTKKK